MVDPRQASPGAAGRFSATEAAFTGFRLVVRQPGVVAVWGLLYLGFTLFTGAGMVLTVGPSMTAVMAQQRAGVTPDPAAAVAMMNGLLPFEGLVLLASLAFNALLVAAVNRAVLRPGQGGPGRLALGGDEGRQLLVFIILAALLFAAYVVLLIGGVVVGVVAALALAGVHAGGGAQAVAGAAGPVVAVMIVVGFAVMAALLFLLTRLSLASPLTFDTGRVDVFGSWRLTRGVFWPLLGAYLLTWLLLMILYIAAFALFAAVVMVAGGGLAAAGVMFRPDMSSLAGYFAPAMLLWILFATAVGTVAVAAILAVPAGAYAQLKALGLIPPPTPPGTATAPTPPAAATDLPRFGR